MKKSILLAAVCAASLGLAACGSEPNVSEYEEPAVDDDEPVDLSPIEETPEAEAETEDATAEEMVEEETAIPEELQVFADAIESARTPREVRAIYDNLAAEGNGPAEQTLAETAARKLNTLILTALRGVNTHEAAERLYEMTLEDSTARRMAQIKMDTYPPEETETPSVAAEAATEEAESE